MKGFEFKLKFPMLLLLMGVVCFSTFALVTKHMVVPAKAAEDPGNAPTNVLTDVVDSNVFLPLVTKNYLRLATRMGYDATHSPITRYPDIRVLRAGWYVDWSVQAAPVRPDGIEHAQNIRVHQKLACGEFQHANRSTCPYAQPLDYLFLPDQATIEAAAKASPGDIWLVGNEMDRVDWAYCAVSVDPCPANQIKQTGQDEILPETYARAYHDLYTIIKNADPTARVANGGVIQATPLRLQYLTIVWDTYRTLYGADMPVDIWNVHNFIIREKKNEYGADIPPGLPGNPTIGAYTTSDWTHIDRAIFDQQIRAFRQWMKDRSQQDKQLIVSEYGMLFHHCAEVDRNGICVKDLNNKQVALDFMTWTFGYFLNTRDCTLGLATDDCLLVQRWTWFGLDIVGTDDVGNPTFGQNEHTSLFNSTTLQMTEAGSLFRQFVENNIAALAK
jgi:hypothetical protein